MPTKRYPHAHKEIMAVMISGMLQEWIIHPSTSPFSSPVLLVTKKDRSLRFCVDYHALKSITVKDHFPIRVVDEILDELHRAAILTKLDLKAAYHQVHVASEDVHKTTCRIIDDHFEFLAILFSLFNASSTFQVIMNNNFCPLLGRYVSVVFDI
ncbi:UNVERIFIED_CONTAM: hypothetical protein Sradi_3859500 [Sesamum radiatum]|uniref:Reverse transcriptase domain-containing protein n=1 Tax=Sesamum radiatum TaxID=300843 RepID=A0AAW2Q211_SESRA